MTTKPITQVCFAINAGVSNEELKERLKALKRTLDYKHGENNYEVHSCHLSRKICLEKGFSTDIPDMFDEIFGSNYVCELDSEPDFDTAMKNIDAHRIHLAEKAETLAFLAPELPKGIIKEISQFAYARGVSLMMYM